MAISSSLSITEPPLIADHPVLDLLNTVAQVNGAAHDFWCGDADVARWLQRLEEFASVDLSELPSGALLLAARQLRELLRPLLQRRKAGERGDPAALNALLNEAPSRLSLQWDQAMAPRLQRRRAGDSARQRLAPLAEAAAELLAQGDFSLVRQCEHEDCTLWFYDRTKSHKRRWCSMATCGNRHKVARFRQRQQE